MSLKTFFLSLSEDELELMCHNYVHNWINEHLQKSNKLYQKYQVEKKLSYIKSASSGLLGKRKSLSTPRTM